MEGSSCAADNDLVSRQLKLKANAELAKKQYDAELEAQRKKLEMEKLAELAALRQKEELRRFGERLDAFLRQRRVKREFSQDNRLDEISARIEDLEHAAEVLVKNTEKQATMARELLVKKQSEHHVVQRKQLVQHRHDIDLLSLMKHKVDEMLGKARDEAKKVYANGNHGYKPLSKPSAPAAKALAAALPPKKLPALLEEDASFLETGARDDAADQIAQEIMVDASGMPVLPMSEPVDLNAPLAERMEVPTTDAVGTSTPAAAINPADLLQENPLSYPNPPPAPMPSAAEESADESDEEAVDAEADAFGSVSPVEQAELPSFRQVSEDDASASEEVDVDAEAETEAQAESFTPEVAADSRLAALPIEAELI
jgi:hypothetical protein